MRAVWKDPIRTGDVCLLLTVFQIAGYLMRWETKTPFQRTVGVCLIAVLLLLFGASCLAAGQCRSCSLPTLTCAPLASGLH